MISPRGLSGVDTVRRSRQRRSHKEQSCVLFGRPVWQPARSLPHTANTEYKSVLTEPRWGRHRQHCYCDHTYFSKIFAFIQHGYKEIYRNEEKVMKENPNMQMSYRRVRLVVHDEPSEASHNAAMHRLSPAQQHALQLSDLPCWAALVLWQRWSWGLTRWLRPVRKENRSIQWDTLRKWAAWQSQAPQRRGTDTDRWQWSYFILRKRPNVLIYIILKLHIK